MMALNELVKIEHVPLIYFTWQSSWNFKKENDDDKKSLRQDGEALDMDCTRF